MTHLIGASNLLAGAVGSYVLVVGVRKACSMSEFRSAVASWGIFVPGTERTVASVMASVEIALGAAVVVTSILSTFALVPRAYLAAVLLTFAAAQLHLWRRGRRGSPCGCGGATKTIGTASLLTAGALAAAVVSSILIGEIG